MWYLVQLLAFVFAFGVAGQVVDLKPAYARTLTHGDIQRGGTHWCNWSITATCQRWKANRDKPSYWRECGPNDMRSGCRYRHMR
jgi:hypothetical protein